MSKNSNRCSVCRSCMGPPPRDRRALADSLGDLVAEAQEDHSFWDWAEAEEADAVQWYEDGILAEGLPDGVAFDDANFFHVGNE